MSNFHKEQYIKQLGAENANLKTSIDLAISAAEDLERLNDTLTIENAKLREIQESLLRVISHKEEQGRILITENAKLWKVVEAAQEHRYDCNRTIYGRCECFEPNLLQALAALEKK